MKKYDTILVFAGDKQQFTEWMHKHLLEFKADDKLNNIRYVSSYEQSLGYSDVMIIKVGTWYEHEWIREAILRLEARNRQPASKTL